MSIVDEDDEADPEGARDRDRAARIKKSYQCSRAGCEEVISGPCICCSQHCPYLEAAPAQQAYVPPSIVSIGGVDVRTASSATSGEFNSQIIFGSMYAPSLAAILSGQPNGAPRAVPAAPSINRCRHRVPKPFTCTECKTQKMTYTGTRLESNQKNVTQEMLPHLLHKVPKNSLICNSCNKQVRSRMNKAQVELQITYCEVCATGVADDLMLLCDGCDDGYHTYCLDPPLSQIPEDEWYCCKCEGHADGDGGARINREERPGGAWRYVFKLQGDIICRLCDSLASRKAQQAGGSSSGGELPPVSRLGRWPVASASAYARETAEKAVLKHLEVVHQLPYAAADEERRRAAEEVARAREERELAERHKRRDAELLLHYQQDEQRKLERRRKAEEERTRYEAAKKMSQAARQQEYSDKMKENRLRDKARAILRKYMSLQVHGVGLWCCSLCADLGVDIFVIRDPSVRGSATLPVTHPAGQGPQPSLEVLARFRLHLLEAHMVSKPASVPLSPAACAASTPPDAAEGLAHFHRPSGCLGSTPWAWYGKANAERLVTICALCETAGQPAAECEVRLTLT